MYQKRPKRFRNSEIILILIYSSMNCKNLKPGNATCLTTQSGLTCKKSG